VITEMATTNWICIFISFKQGTCLVVECVPECYCLTVYWFPKKVTVWFWCRECQFSSLIVFAVTFCDNLRNRGRREAIVAYLRGNKSNSCSYQLRVSTISIQHLFCFHWNVCRLACYLHLLILSRNAGEDTVFTPSGPRYISNLTIWDDLLSLSFNECHCIDSPIFEGECGEIHEMACICWPLPYGLKLIG